jgi:hypothetical protein
MMVCGIYLEETYYEDVQWTQLARNRVQWKFICKHENGHLGLKGAGKFLTSCTTWPLLNRGGNVAGAAWREPQPQASLLVSQARF